MEVVSLEGTNSRVIGAVSGTITISIYNSEYKGHPNFLIQSDSNVSNIADILEDVLISY